MDPLSSGVTRTRPASAATCGVHRGDSMRSTRPGAGGSPSYTTSAVAQTGAGGDSDGPVRGARDVARGAQQRDEDRPGLADGGQVQQRLVHACLRLASLPLRARGAP